MSQKTTVGWVAMRGGNQYDRAGGILADEPTLLFAKRRGRGNLYILVEVSGPEGGREALAQELASVAHEAYYSWRGSVTAGLQQALGQVNDLLFEENRKSLAGEQRTAGMSCVVLRDDDLFLAQAGPAAVCLAHEDTVHRYPDRSPWLGDVPPDEVDAAPLGARRDAQIDLFHAQVSEGDAVLLVESHLARDLPPETWPDVLGGASLQAILDGLVDASHGADLSALLVMLAEEETAPIVSQPAAPAEAAAPPAQQAGPPLLERAGSWLQQLRAGERLRALGQGAAVVVGGLGAALLTLFQRLMPSQQPPPQAIRRQPEPVMKQAKSKEQKKGKKAGTEQSDLVQRVLIGVALAIPLVVAIVVLVVVVQRGQKQRAEIDALWQQASQNWQQANTNPDPAIVRTSLVEAQRDLVLYLERRPDDADALDLQGKVQVRLDEIGQVQRISWVGKLHTYPSDADLTRVVVEGNHVFVMDRGEGKVYHHQLDDFQQALKPETAETVLVSKGQQVRDVLVADLVDMAWMPTGNGRQKAALVILESGGNLLEYDPTTRELVPLDVAATDQWQFPKLVGSHSGRFYVLEETANQIWRYDPTPDDYSAPPEPWLKTDVDLLGVEDMAVGDSIYLLYANGQIRKLSQGVPDAFDISDWDTPPRSPTALFTRPPDEVQWLYVADRGNSRIVQCSKEGKFKRQFRLLDSQLEAGQDLLADVSSLFVKEIDGHAFVLSGQSLYLLILPEAQG
jgi:hypothetical protein